MTGNSFPEQALANPVTVVTLAGREYRMREPNKRRCMYLLGKAQTLIGEHKLDQIDEARLDSDMTMQGHALMAACDILEFLYQALELKPPERNRIDDALNPSADADAEGACTPMQITQAFSVILERINRPFVGSQNTTPNPTETNTSPDPSTNGEP